MASAGMILFKFYNYYIYNVSLYIFEYRLNYINILNLYISFDQITRLEAESLTKKIKNFNFVCCVVILHSIFNQINLASKVLLKVTLDISGAENILSETINFLKKLRCD